MMVVKTKYLAVMLVLVLVLGVGVVLGAVMNAQKGGYIAERDAVLEKAQALDTSLIEGHARLAEAANASDDSAADKDNALIKATSEKDYRKSEVSLLEEVLERTRNEIEKKVNTIQTQRDTFTERDNMVTALTRDRDALLKELTEQANGSGVPISTPVPTAAPEPTATPGPVVVSEGTTVPTGEVVATIGDTEIVYAQLKKLSEQNQPRYEKNYNLTDEAVANVLTLEDLNALIDYAVISGWAQELGIEPGADDLTASAEAFYNSLLEQRTSANLNDGASEQAAREQAAEYLEKYHYTVEDIAEMMRIRNLSEGIVGHFDALAVASEDALAAEYDLLVQGAKERYEADPEAFPREAVQSAPLYYYPAGYRVVRHVLFLFTGDEQIEVAHLLKERAELAADDARAAEIDARIDEIRTKYLDRAETVRKEYEAGAAFEDLIQKYGEDPGMTGGVTAKRGYYVSKDTTVFDVNFRDGAMAIEKAGDLSAAVVSGFGVHVIRYEADAPEGPAAFEEVKGDVTALLANRELADARDLWIAAHPIRKYFDLVVNGPQGN
jgi:parvulin-like peptidyl-prolyl isomerase